MELTAKQKLFVKEYLVDLNATQAAIRAGYSEKTAMEQGYQLLQKTSVQQMIQHGMDERSKRVEIKADSVLRELAKIGFSDIKDFLAYRTVVTKVGTTKEGEDIFDHATVVELKDSDSVDGTLIQEVKQTKDGVSFKLHSKMDALDRIGKHLKLFTDKIEHSGEMNHNVRQTVDLKKLNDEELEQLGNLVAKYTDS